MKKNNPQSVGPSGSGDIHPEGAGIHAPTLRPTDGDTCSRFGSGTGHHLGMTLSDVQATFCATLLDEWCRAGVTHAVVCPGSRSTPMALAIADESRVTTHVVLDERSGAFFALGLARATGIPAVLLCTSGTAAVEFHPAVAEGHLDRVPMIVVTADRPPELHGIGAPQTVDQNRLFGRSVRDYFEPGVADTATASTWRSLASRAFLAATSGASGPGPVQLNLAFREPLVGRVRRLPVARAKGRPWHATLQLPSADRAVADSVASGLWVRLAGRRGVIVAGAGSGNADALRRLAAVLGWPLIADLRSGARGTGPNETNSGRTVTVDHIDAILRSPAAAEALRPDVALRFGAPWASKVLNQWLAGVGDDVLVDPHHSWLDPNRASQVTVHADPTFVAQALADILPSGDPSWLALWAKADAASRSVMRGQLDSTSAVPHELSEPAWVRALIGYLPNGSELVISSSMPIRHAEWFSAGRRDVHVHANRGANGIDGVVSTALGVAAADRGPTFALIGDLAFLHDAGALVLAGQGRVRCTFVVVDNAGGGIFEFLPQATSVERSRFETLYGTPQNVDIVALCKAHRLRTFEPKSLRALRSALTKSEREPGVVVIVVRTDRRETVKVLEMLNAAVVVGVERILGVG